MNENFNEIKKNQKKTKKIDDVPKKQREKRTKGAKTKISTTVPQ